MRKLVCYEKDPVCQCAIYGASAGMVSKESAAFVTRGGRGQARARAISGNDQAEFGAESEHASKLPEE